MERAVIEALPGSHDDIVGVRASGVLTVADYEQTLFPLLEKAIAEHGKARLLVEIADSFATLKLDAAWEDAAFGFAHRADFSRIARVGGPQWIVWSVKILTPFIVGEMRAFSAARMQHAWKWIAAR